MFFRFLCHWFLLFIFYFLKMEGDVIDLIHSFFSKIGISWYKYPLNAALLVHPNVDVFFHFYLVKNNFWFSFSFIFWLVDYLKFTFFILFGIFYKYYYSVINFEFHSIVVRKHTLYNKFLKYSNSFYSPKYGLSV